MTEWRETNLVHPPSPWWKDAQRWRDEGKHTVYLAGSMDPETEDWRETVLDVLSEGGNQNNLIAIDPRQPDYDPLWHQRSDREAVLSARKSAEDGKLLEPWEESALKFDALVDWEMRGVQLADQVVFHFEPGARSPVGMLLLGIVHLRGPQVIVHCPRGYWRREYVQAFCERFMIALKPDLTDLGNLARYRL